MKINIEKTKNFYSSLDESSLCSCSYCQNYYLHIKKEYPEIDEYLFSLGVDIEKPYEASPLEEDENGFIEYCCCQYIVFGECSADFTHKINDVEFRIALSYPDTKIKDNHFLIEFYPVKLKYLFK